MQIPTDAKSMVLNFLEIRNAIAPGAIINPIANIKPVVASVATTVRVMAANRV